MIATPDFETYRMDNKLTEAVANRDVVKVTWEDGRESQFHNIWLRDNCACIHCTDSASHERVYSFLDIPKDIHPQTVSVTKHGSLRVTWSDDRHESHYHPGWLRHFDYHNGRRPTETWEIETWDQSLEQNLPLFSAEAVLNDKEYCYNFLVSIRRLGIALVTDMPKDETTFARLANKSGLLRDMNWGKIFEIIAKPEGEYIANRGFALDSHSDAASREYMPGLQIFQCVENTSEGGESFWVDGFHIARILQDHSPDEWEILTSIPWEQASRSQGSHYRWNAPIIELDEQGNIRAVRDTTWLREPLRVAYDDVPRLYSAYRAYAQLKADRRYQVERKLIEGDVAFVDNRRVLHGRRSFKPETGLRHIRTCYGEREELLSAIRMIERARNERAHGD